MQVDFEVSGLEDFSITELWAMIDSLSYKVRAYQHEARRIDFELGNEQQ